MKANNERIVLDPHALVLALTTRPEGNRRVLEACLRGDLLPVIGGRPYLDRIEDMVNRAVVQNRCPLPDHDISKLLDAYLQSCEWVNMHKLWRPDVPERTGLPLLELAEAGGATTLITPSPRLLGDTWEFFPHITIVQAHTFMRRWQ